MLLISQCPGNTNTSCTTSDKIIQELDHVERRRRLLMLREELPTGLQWSVTPVLPDIIAECSYAGTDCTNFTHESANLSFIEKNPSLESWCHNSSAIDYYVQSNRDMRESRDVQNRFYMSSNDSPKYGTCVLINLFNGLKQDKKLGPEGGLSIVVRTSGVRDRKEALSDAADFKDMEGAAVLLSQPSKLVTDL